MTVKELRILVDNLDEYIRIPGGIERLKKTILRLAVSGQLVPQDSAEGTGEQLHLQIQAEKSKLVDAGKLKKQKPLADIPADEQPFSVPDNWKWVRLADICNFSIGRTPSRVESDYWATEHTPWVSIADLKENGHIQTTKESVSQSAFEKVFQGMLVPAGTLLYSFKLTIGKMSIIDMDATHNEAIASLQTFSPTTTEYLFRALRAIDPTARTNSAVKGKTLNSTSLSLLEIPLPPLGEQQRIVDKIDQLFAAIDELSAQYRLEQLERRKLTVSSLSQLARGQGTLALSHLSEIISTKADIQDLQNTILHLAVSGQLVPHDSAEGTGEELYEQILAESSGHKKQKSAGGTASDSGPFAIPDSWLWVPLADIYKSIPPVTQVKTQDFQLTGAHPVVDQGQSYIAGYTDAGPANIVDIPVIVFGDHTREVKLIDFDFVVGADGVKILQPILIDSKYFYTLIRVFRPTTRGYGRHFKMLNQKIVPLPPLAEQKRIVQKTETLLNLTTNLEKYLI